MQVGDLISVDLEKVYLGIVIELDPGWVYVHFLDGDVGYYGLLIVTGKQITDLHTVPSRLHM